MTSGLRDVPVELGAVLSPICLTATWLVLGFVSPGYYLWGTHVAPYSAVSQPISGLGLGPTGPFMNSVFVITGLMLVVGAIGIFQQIPELSPRARWLATFLLSLPGIGSVIDGTFTFDHMLPHLAGFLLLMATVVGFPVAGWSMRRLPGWSRLGTGLIAAGPLTLALVVLYFLTFTPTIQGIQTGVAGLTERTAVLEIGAWYVALGWTVFRKRNQSDRNRGQATAPRRAAA